MRAFKIDTRISMRPYLVVGEGTMDAVAKLFRSTDVTDQDIMGIEPLDYLDDRIIL